MAQGNYVALVILWVLTVMVFILSIIMGVFAHGVATETIGIFDTSVKEISILYPTQFSPAVWAEWYWIAIWTWQGAWLLYGMASMCREGADDEKLMSNPELISIPVYCLFTFANGLNIGGLFLWDRNYIIPGLVFMALLATTLWICLGISCWDLSRNYETIYENDLNADPWLVRIFLHNGLGIYAAYCTVLFFMQLTIVIEDKQNVAPIDATTITLSILDFFIVIYFLLDVTVLDGSLRYVLTPYISVAYLFGAVIDRNWNTVEWSDYRNSTYVATSLGVVICFAITKIIVMAIRSSISPLDSKARSYSTSSKLRSTGDYALEDALEMEPSYK